MLNVCIYGYLTKFLTHNVGVYGKIYYLYDYINHKIIARTTRKSIYVVNHNMIFKGNLGEFIAKYKIKYPDGCKVDSNGKIILEH